MSCGARFAHAVCFALNDVIERLRFCNQIGYGHTVQVFVDHGVKFGPHAKRGARCFVIAGGGALDKAGNGREASLGKTQNLAHSVLIGGTR